MLYKCRYPTVEDNIYDWFQTGSFGIFVFFWLSVTLTPDEAATEAVLVRLPHRPQVGVKVIDEWLARRNVHVSDGVLLDAVQPVCGRCAWSLMEDG